MVVVVMVVGEGRHCEEERAQLHNEQNQKN
jgi:hypothetical protein